MPALINVVITGANTGQVGQSIKLTLTAWYSDGSQVDVSSTATWSVSDSQVAIIDATGLLQILGTGTIVVLAAYNGVTTKFHFTAPALLSTELVVPPSAVPGQTVSFRLVQKYSDGSSVDISNQTTWFSGDTSLGTIDASGNFTCKASGVVTVGEFQTSQNIQSVPYTVLPDALVSISVSAPAGELTAGGLLQLTATGTYNGGILTDITSKVSWNAANPNASVSSSGLVTAQSQGLAVLVASFQGVQGSITLNIFPAQNPDLQPQFYSHLTQVMKNYFDVKDVRVREAKYTLDAQLLNIAAQQLELSDAKFDRELKSTTLNRCPVNIDNKGVYYQQSLPSGFDFTVDHEIQSKDGAILTALTAYDDTLPVPARVAVDTRFPPTSLFHAVLFTASGIGLPVTQNWAVQRIANLTLPMDGRIGFWLEGTGFNQVNISIRITGQRAPQSAWASKRVITSETLVLTSIGYVQSKFAWATISDVQISNLAVGLTLTGQVGTFGLARTPDVARPYTDPTSRDVTFRRYWTYEDGLLKEEYLASNYQGYRYIQSYASSPVSAIAVEPNTYGMFIGQGTNLIYVDRREPLPTSLSSTALTAEPYYGLDVSIDETRSGALRYVLLRPVAYGNSSQVSQYRYILKTPQGSTYVLTPDGVLATFSATAGWRRGVPVSLTIPLAQIGTYVITLQCAGPNNTVLADAVPYPNFALAPKAQFDLSSIVPQILGLSFDERGRLWVWSGEFAIPLTFSYDAYLLDAPSQSIYLTDQVKGLVIDGVSV